MTTDIQILTIVKNVLKHKGLPDADVEMSSVLYDGGLGLDSLPQQSFLLLWRRRSVKTLTPAVSCRKP